MAATVTVPEEQGVSDDDLYKLADLLDNEEAELLGRKLELEKADITRWMETNNLTGTIRTKGTRQMLGKWKSQTYKMDQRRELMKALKEAKLIKALEAIFGVNAGRPTDDHKGNCEKSEVTQASLPANSPVNDGGTPTTSCTLADAPPISGTQGTCVVTGKQINALVKELPYQKFSELSTNLGVEHTESSKILKKHRGEYDDAYRDVLEAWKKTEKGGLRSDLEDALKKADLGGLCRKF